MIETEHSHPGNIIELALSKMARAIKAVGPYLRQKGIYSVIYTVQFKGGNVKMAGVIHQFTLNGDLLYGLSEGNVLIYLLVMILLLN